MRIENIYFGTSKKPIRHAILHCAAINDGQFDGMSGEQIKQVIKGWHIERGFNDIGYHYIVLPRGHVTIGRSLTRVGAHTVGLNTSSLGVLLVETRKIIKVAQYGDYFTPLQKQAVTEILRHHGITKVTGHNDHAPRLCPGFKVDQTDFLPSDANCWQKIGAILKNTIKNAQGIDRAEN